MPGVAVEDVGPPSPPESFEDIDCEQDGNIYLNNTSVPQLNECEFSCTCLEGDILCDDDLVTQLSGNELH